MERPEELKDRLDDDKMVQNPPESVCRLVHLQILFYIKKIVPFCDSLDFITCLSLSNGYLVNFYNSTCYSAATGVKKMIGVTGDEATSKRSKYIGFCCTFRPALLYKQAQFEIIPTSLTEA